MEQLTKRAASKGDRVMSDATLRQGNRLFELILRETDPHAFSQALIENWGVVQAIGRGEADQATIAAWMQQHGNPYRSEKVEPRFFYPEGYKPNMVDEQVAILLDRLPWLDTSHVVEIAADWGQYEQADGLYVVPKPTVLAAHLGLEDHWTNFGLLTEQGPLAALADQRTFTNYRAGELGADRYRLAESAKAALQALETSQPGDLLVFPAQTGRLYAGFSTRNAVWEIGHEANQWPVPAYCGGWMLYVNPHRLEKFEHLAIDCPGDEYRLGASGEFSDALYFYFNDGLLYCDALFVDYANVYFGAASGFVRQ